MAARSASQLRSSPQWKAARARVLRHATHCAICGGELDFRAPKRSARAPSVDHIVPLAYGGAPFDRTNLRPVHIGCNASRGARRVPARVPARPVSERVDQPPMDDCHAIWPRRFADPHVWLEGYCSDPDSCPRSARAEEAAQAAMAVRS